MDIVEMIENFTDEHPFWTWVLARLVICVCACIIAAMGFFGLLALCTPFVLINDGSGWGAFAAWFWLPLIATAIWLMCSIIRYVWEGVI